MIDIRRLATNPETYAAELKKRSLDPNVATEAKQKYERLTSSKQTLDELREKKNEFNKTILTLNEADKKAAIEKMQTNAKDIKKLENEVKQLEEDLAALVYQIPNLTWSDIPVGADDSANVETATFGERPEFNFAPKHYYELPCFLRDYQARQGVAAAGARGYYLTGKLALLQRALFRYVEDKVIEAGFNYVIPPVMVNEDVMYGTGFFPSSKNDFYTVNPGQDDLYLVGSSEPSLIYLLQGQKLDLDEPRLLSANTTCFRREAGSYGQDTKGGIRVHQFEKIELVAVCKPEQSPEVFDVLTDFFTARTRELGLYVHHLEVSSGDISLKNHRQIDIEAWFPAQNKFRELCSSSNCTDYQTRNLKIRYATDQGGFGLAHSLNCTGVTNRTMFAILEQFQQADGSVIIPEVLVPYAGFDTLS